MPAQHNAYHSITSSGSFVMRASFHNRDRFSSARDDLSRPYPSYEDVYLRSNTSNPGSDEFQDLGLNNFLVTQRRVARRKLERLQLTPYQGSLLSRGVQPQREQREPYNMVLEAVRIMLSLPSFSSISPIYCKTSCPKHDVKRHNYALTITTTTRGTCLWSKYPVLVIIRELEASTSRPSVTS